MLEIRKGTSAKSYENTFFREFSENLKNMFEKYSTSGLLIANSECEAGKRLQIDALLITEKAVCIIDFKNFSGKIILPENTKSDFEFGIWKNENGDIIKGGSYINPFIQLKNQKNRFINVIERNLIPKLPISDKFNPFHTIKTVCFQKPIELIGLIPSKEELNFFILDKNNYLEKIRDIIDISDKDVSLSHESFSLFKEIFKADIFNLSENYEKTNNFENYKTETDFNQLYPDQQSAINEITSFIQSEEDRIFVLQGTSLSGKTHLIPYIQDIAFKNQIQEVKLFASSGRIANNLLKENNLEFNSMYSYIYGGSTTNKNRNDKENNEKPESEKSIDLEIIPLRRSDDTDNSIFIVDESHLVSDNYHQSIDLIFGSGQLLTDFINFTDLDHSKRKIIFIGDSFQLSIGKKEESPLNTEYLSSKFQLRSKAFQLVDKEKKSPIVEQALKAVNCIRNQTFNNLSFELGSRLSKVEKNKSLALISKSIQENSNSRILCYSNLDAQKVNVWIKKSILKNGQDLSKGDLILFGNNIRVEDENDPFAESKKIYNGQFGTVVNIFESFTNRSNNETLLIFREVEIQLKETNHILKFLSFENFRLSDKGELSKEEVIAYKNLLYQLAKNEIPNFKEGKLQSDDELKLLLNQLNDGKKVKTKVNTKIQRLLSYMPSTEYYKYKNAAQLRFGWALTVHKAMSYRWDQVFFNVETGGGKTNEAYFKWIYTGIIRATQKVNLINYHSISPFDKTTIKTSAKNENNKKEFFYIADIEADSLNSKDEASNKHNFPENENKNSILQLFQFLNLKTEANKLIIHSIRHANYQELYEIKSNKNETATISIYFNKKGQFKTPTLINSQPKEFGEKVIEILKSNFEIKNFDFIKDEWRRMAYEKIYAKLTPDGTKIGYIIQTPFKDTIKLIKNNEFIVFDMYYDGDGFFSTIIATAYSEVGIWNEFQSILHELKG
jgi:hypothetical protein